MATKDLLKNNVERFDDNMTNKRIKTDHLSKQFLEFSTLHHPYSIAQQIVVDKIDYTYRHPSTIKKPTSCLQTLPNELFLHIFSYMNHTAIVRVFFGLNQRFNSLIFECVRQFRFLDNTSVTWYIDYLMHLENAIETISLGVKSVPYVFSCNHSYPNLRSIIIRNQFNFSVKLNVERCSGLGAIISCLNLLRIFSTWTTKDFEITPLFETDAIQRTPDNQMDTFFNTLPCPAIERLSVYVWHTHDWMCLCGRAPNLTYLRIIYEEAEDPTDNSYPSTITSLIKGPSHLTDLHIIFGHNDVSLEALEWLISCCRSSLKQFTISSSHSQQINGKTLEALLRPCQQLTKITFDIEFDNTDINTTEILRQFQTDWWLDTFRLPILLHRTSMGRTWIVTMPCSSLKYAKLDVDSNTWLLNKGQLDSPLIYFSKVTSIHMINENDQPITINLLNLIAHIFRSSHQSLKFTCWGFHQPELVYEQITNKSVIIPQLPHVRYLSMKYTDCRGLDAMSLVIWLLVAPNVKELNLSHMTNENKFQLAKDLEKMIQRDQHLKSILNRIEAIDIFSSDSTGDEPTKMKIFFLFWELFPEAVIHN